jgi:hypothetical protein
MPWTKANRLSATKPTSGSHLTKLRSICKIAHVSAKLCKDSAYFDGEVCSKCVVRDFSDLATRPPGVGVGVTRAVLGLPPPVVTEAFAELYGAKLAEAMERVG